MRTELGTFTIAPPALWAAWLAGRVRFDYEVMAPTSADSDAFTPHGSEHALDRWADDGGRAP